MRFFRSQPDFRSSRDRYIRLPPPSSDHGGPDLHVDYSQRSLTESDPATNNLSQRRRTRYGNNNDKNMNFIITL